jgi:hypothetical protein
LRREPSLARKRGEQVGRKKPGKRKMGKNAAKKTVKRVVRKKEPASLESLGRNPGKEFLVPFLRSH